MSRYRGTITLSVVFTADNGHTADEWLQEIATEIREEMNDDVEYDEDDEWWPAETFYSITDSTATLPVGAL